jgi:hypothetical protein
VTKFRKGKQYKFSKEVFLSNPIHKKNYYNNEIIKYWVDQLDDQIIEVITKDEGFFDGYTVRPEWCEEVDG